MIKFGFVFCTSLKRALALEREMNTWYVMESLLISCMIRGDETRAIGYKESFESVLNVSNNGIFASLLNNLAVNQDTAIQTVS